MGKKILMLFACLFMTAGMAFAQKTVTGTVIDGDTGEPIVGAAVKIKGSAKGTLTDMDGKYTLTGVPNDAQTLVVSFMGMKTVEVPAKNGTKLSLTATTSDLDEVMVVAYGTTTKAQFTGSAKVVGGEELEQIQSTNALDALTGHVAGVELFNPTGDPSSNTPTMRIRGITSINAGTQPLIILDGTPYAGDMNTINNSDIESLTVLKDAAANALYGARGANGVIVITTKRGKAGAGAKVTLDASWGSNSRARRQYKTIDDPRQYYETYYTSLKNYAINEQGYSNINAHQWANKNLTSDGGYGLGYNIYNVPDGQTLIGLNGKVNPNAVMGSIVNFEGEDYMLMSDDWMDEIYHNGLRQEYNLNVSNATEKSNFMASFGYLDNEGITDNSNFSRFNGRLKADIQAKSWLKLGGNMSYTHYSAQSLDEDGSSNSSANLFAVASQVAPIYPLYLRDANGVIRKDANGFTMYDWGGKNGSWMGITRPHLSNSNAVSSNLLDNHSYEGNAATATGFGEIRFAKDFKFTSTNTITLDESRSTSFTNPYYGQYASNNGSIGKGHSRSFTYAFQQLLDWGHVYGKHDVNVMIGHESYRAKGYSLSAHKTAMFDPTNWELDGAVTNGSASSYTSDYNNEGYFGRAQYNFDGKYFGSASYRRDASSRFHPDNRWGNFFSVGAAWVISKENFMEDADWVDFLKLKFSYGEQGNDNIGNYRYTNTFNIVNSGGSPAATPATMGNKDITWEKNGNLNLGLDFELFDNRLSGTVEYFWRKTSDMLFSFPLPTSYGYTSYYANIGDMKNQGVEIDLNAEIIRTKNWKWNVGANLTHYKNEITMLPDERKTMTTHEGYKGYANGNFFLGEGLSMYSFYMPEYAGVYTKDTWQQTGDKAFDESMAGHSMWYTTKYKTDANGNVIKDAEGNPIEDGRIKTTDYSKAEDYLVGKMVPKIYGGFRTSLQFHGFDLGADFAYQLGGKVYDSDYASFMSVPTTDSKGTNFHQDLLNAWTSTNNSDIPRNQFGSTEDAGTLSSRFLTSANYLSLQNLSFGYTLPTSLLKKAQIEKIRLYVNCSNVWLWSARRGLDPRTAMISTGYGASNASYYSTMRTISAGVNVTF